VTLWAAEPDRARASPPHVPGARIEEVVAGSAAEVATAMGEEGDLVQARFARGCRCLAVRAGGGVAAYGWVSTGPEWIGELGIEIRPGPDEAYVWNCVTLPPHRRRGLFRALLHTAVDGAGSQGLARLWIGTVDGVGVSAVAHAGFQPLLSIGVLELPGTGWLSVRGAPGAPAATVAAALQALAGGGERLRSGPRPRGRRRH
jgi:GNAT superfamily N-acetyltransferase